VVTFSEPLNESQDPTSVITVSDGTSSVAGTVVRSSATTLTFTPNLPWASDTMFTVTVNGARDVTGNAQTTAFQSTFRSHDTHAPALVLQQPVPGTWVNSGLPTIVVVASDSLSGVDMNTGTLKVDGAAVAVTISGNSLTGVPAQSLTDGVHTVEASVQDRAGNTGPLAGEVWIDTTAPVTTTDHLAPFYTAWHNGPVTVNLSATDTNLPGHTAVVEMPATIPAAPTNFYPAEITSNAPALAPVAAACGTNFFATLRVGYEHVYHGDNNDSYWAGVKFYAYGDQWRQNAGKNGWLIPDADAEISSGFVPKPDNRRDQGSDSGLRFRADFTWPWFHWTLRAFAREDSLCPFCKPLTFALGPTVNVGFDHLYNDGSDYRFAHYAGVRLTFNRDGFIEYTAGGTEGLDGTRQQVVAEIPFYESRDGEVRYYLRGLWNHGANNRPDILEGGLFLEIPFTTLVKPDKWGDLVPFAQ